ncbi:hypothetical protein H1230_14905 [Paenibacillus sp. 19GGS1-52]|uniref:NifB/NifX family molybdenum-iron cluster-binding protein n=1 Tax=Paenibacillus sp. 19GGS1-52 TaxID=2758563 RepID=UPI001EFAA519|nr:NifB/NifX family molybdenum-iron cluster-binding protein [Paenibacillus sp. 19GGS1-52]ULO09937.1 hypothetical protein H1230_14905 [Paenibacillus sp. 19GGS1-52]
MSWKVAIGSSDGHIVNQHFGRCDRFLIYEVDEDGNYSRIENRIYEHLFTLQGHAENKLRAVAELLDDCSFVLVSHIGPGARAVLHGKGIQALAVNAPIEQALDRLTLFLRSGRESILN